MPASVHSSKVPALIQASMHRVSIRGIQGSNFNLLTSSNASFSARPSWRAQPFSACARAENAPSRSKRPRFTEEDAKLVDLKERRGWSWEDIQRSFPRRSIGSL